MKLPARSSPWARASPAGSWATASSVFITFLAARCFYCERRLFSQCPAYKKVGLTAGFDPNGGGFAEYVRAMPWIAERGMVAIPGRCQF